MKRVLVAVVAVAVLTGWVSLACAQDAQYALKDYMPMAVGSKWIMKTTNRQGETTVTIEVAQPKEIAAQQVSQLLTKDAQGALQRGSLETVTDNAYCLYGSIRMPRGDQGGDPITSLYDPVVAFPAKMTVGQHAEAVTKSQMRGQAQEITIKLDLVGLETVTVPKGTFENCLKLVFTTSFGQGEMKRTVWYAKGIGAVKTEQPGFGQNAQVRVQELLEYLPAPAPAQ